MSFAITHFALGALLTTAFIALVDRPLQFERSLVLVGGAWALVPDVHWVTPWFEVPLSTLHANSLANLFWFHQLLDTLDPEKSPLFAATMLVGLILVPTALESRRGVCA